MKLFCNACINGINGRSLHENAGEGEITTLEFWVSIKASVSSALSFLRKILSFMPLMINRFTVSNNTRSKISI